MKKAIVITVSIICILGLLVWLAMKSNGYEIPRKDKYADVPYFPAISNSNRFRNVVLDSIHVIDYYANKSVFCF